MLCVCVRSMRVCIVVRCRKREKGGHEGPHRQDKTRFGGAKRRLCVSDPFVPTQPPEGKKGGTGDKAGERKRRPAGQTASIRGPQKSQKRKKGATVCSNFGWMAFACCFPFSFRLHRPCPCLVMCLSLHPCLLSNFRCVAHSCLATSVVRTYMSLSILKGGEKDQSFDHHRRSSSRLDQSHTRHYMLVHLYKKQSARSLSQHIFLRQSTPSFDAII